MISVTYVFGFALAQSVASCWLCQPIRRGDVTFAGRAGLVLSLVLLLAVTGFSQTSSPSIQTNDATNVANNSAVLNGTLNPGSNSVGVWFEYGTTTSFGTRTTPQVFPGSKSTTFIASLQSLQPHTTYYFRAVLYPAVAGAPNINGDTKTFTTTGDAVTTSSVTAVTLDATSVTSSGATLNGSLNPGGNAVTTWFDWGTSSSFGNRTDVQTIPSGTTTIPTSFSLSKLQPHTVYYFRLDVYAGSSGAYAVGDIKTFTTSDAPAAAPLTVTTLDASGVTSSGATLNGKITGGGSAFAGWFEYGTTTSLGTHSDAQTFSASTTNVSLTQILKNLSPSTTYYFRVVGYTGGGANILGDVLSFTTAAGDAPGTISITASQATAITSTSVVLKASVNSATSLVGFFEWGTTSSLGSRTDLQNLAPGTGVTFTQALSSLQPNTTYYFRAVVATSNTTSVVRSDTKNFTTTSGTSTTLSVSTDDASAVQSTSAELRGMINPAGTTATGWFEWGTSTAALSNQTTAQTFSGSSPSSFSFSLSGLQASTPYFFRAVGQNSGGTVKGDVKTFTTPRVTTTKPDTTGVETGQIKSGYVIITPDSTSDAPTLTFTYGTLSQGSVQNQAGFIPTTMATDASLFVEIIPSISRNIAVAITNPGSTTNAVTLTLRDENGFVLGSPAVVSIPAHQQVAKFVSDVFGTDIISNGLRGSLRMVSSSPFAVIGVRYEGAVFSALPVAVNAGVPGVPSIALTAGSTPNVPAAGTVGGTTAIIVPQFVNAGGYATQIALVNNTNSTLVGRIDLFDPSGNPLAINMNGETRSTFTYSIPVGGTFILAPRDSNGQSPI
jgi:phosphodiesterase/alkaline phosphatase D-like protein